MPHYATGKYGLLYYRRYMQMEKERSCRLKTKLFYFTFLRHGNELEPKFLQPFFKCELRFKVTMHQKNFFQLFPVQIIQKLKQLVVIAMRTE